MSIHSRSEATLLLVVLTAMVMIFTGACAAAAQEPGQLPIEHIKDAALGENSTVIYTLNGDGTVSGYDTENKDFNFSRVDVLGPEDDDPKEIAAAPDGGVFAIRYNTPDRITHVAVFREADDGAEPVTLVHDYTLGRDVEQGYVSLEFSNDGSRVYVVSGPSFVLVLNAAGDKGQTEFSVGDSPIEIEESSDGTRFVLNEKSESVSVIESGASSVAAEIEVGTSPSDILYNSITNKVYVSHVGSNDVYIIDPSLNTVEAVVEVGGDPTTLRYDRESGNVFLVSNSSGELTTIFPGNGISSIDIGTAAYFKSARVDAYFKQSNRKLYLLNTTESSLQVYDAVAGTVSEPIDTPSFPTEVLGTSASENVYFWHWGANSISEIDTTDNSASYISDTVSSNEIYFSKPQSITVDEQTNRIFVSNLGADYVTVIDGETQKPIEKIQVGRTIQNVFLHDGLRKLYAVSPSDNSVTSIKIDENYVTKTIPLDEQSRGGAINEETNRIYYSNARAGTISVVDAVADEVVDEITFPEDSFPLVSTVDETRNKLYVSLYGADAIAVIDGETNTIESTIETGPNPIFVRYIPQIDKIFATIESAEEVLVIDPEDPGDRQTIGLPGEPYRIFFDEVSEHVFINRRGEDLVSELVQNSETGVYELVSTRPMKYWGETDARPYNMVTYNRETDLAYFTAGKANEVVVVTVDHDENDSVVAEWYATIRADGSVQLASSDSQDAGGQQTGEQGSGMGLSTKTYLLIVGALALLLGGIATIIYVNRRRSGNGPDPDPDPGQGGGSKGPGAGPTTPLQ